MATTGAHSEFYRLIFSCSHPHSCKHGLYVFPCFFVNIFRVFLHMWVFRKPNLNVQYSNSAKGHIVDILL